ncbi:Trifunctional nucleotide phosphoesterase proteinYfkN [Ceratocystis lukuohia]|uniref:Trifunctional nucleotide phosphoesterase proteinYfkN n=1 Tax=Ceratocystis lukuohia TaxID=2019550 RepID=A0ABR4MTY6_9PEZI
MSLPSHASVTYKSNRPSDNPATAYVRLLHYNDVYHLEQSSAEPVGGLARFVSVVNEYRESAETKTAGLVTVFSGDAFNPSLESSLAADTAALGEHMVPVLNTIGTDVACVGNHDFDFGVAQFSHLTSKCTFPWLLANVFDPALGDNIPLGGAKQTHWITTPTGVKIAFLGLGEREWLATINSLPPNIIYKSASAVAKEIVPKLRADGADLVVCVSHQREPNDNKLAENTDGLFDLILGGHDHYYAHAYIKGTHVLRSGTDFKNLSYIQGWKRTDGSGKWDFDILRRDICSDVAPDAEASALVENLTASLKHDLAKPVGWTAVPLDARFVTVRTRESNIGNFVCDIMRGHYGADAALMASGTIRGDTIYPPGVLLVKDITNCFPFEDPAILIRVTGQAIWDALENGVCQYPALEGRFPQVSNIVYTFDPKLAPGKRIVEAKLGGSPIVLDKKYTLATRGYMGRGKDGYSSLLVEPEGGVAEEIVCEENGILISAMMRQYFMSLRTVGKWRYLSTHWDSIAHKLVPLESADTTNIQKADESTGLAGTSAWNKWLNRRLGIGRRPVNDNGSVDGEAEAGDKEADDQDNNEDDEVDKIDSEILLLRKFFAKWAHKAGVNTVVCDAAKQEDLAVDWTRVIAPKLEGRIVMVE